MKLNHDFQEFIESFVTHNVRFLIVGGYALAASVWSSEVYERINFLRVDLGTSQTQRTFRLKVDRGFSSYIYVAPVSVGV